MKYENLLEKIRDDSSLSLEDIRIMAKVALNNTVGLFAKIPPCSCDKCYSRLHGQKWYDEALEQAGVKKK